MDRSCEFCKHKEKPWGADPCLGCHRAKCSENATIIDRVNFEPKEDSDKEKRNGEIYK